MNNITLSKLKISATFIVVFALCLVLCACELLFPTVVSISAEYSGGDVEVGRTLNKDEVKVTAHYSDKTKKTLKSVDFKLEYDFSSAGQAEVKVCYVYNGKEMESVFTVTVKEPAPPEPVVTLESITAVYNGEDIEINGTLNKADIVVTALYSDNTTKMVTDFTVGEFNSSTAGNKQVTITYVEGDVTKTCVLTITVEAEPAPPEPVITLESITAVYNGESVKVGGTLNKADIAVTAHYSNDTSKPVTDFTVGEFNSSTAGDKQVTITYVEDDVTKTCVVTITVEAEPAPPEPVVTLESITAVYNGESVKVGGTLNNDDIAVTAHYSNDTSNPVTNFSVGGFSSASAGTCVVTVSYSENGLVKECTVNITVVDDSHEIIVNSNLSIHFLELGNQYTGDCVYIKAGDTDILIDAGSRKNSASTIIKYVNQYVADGKLEYVIATHEHQDHISGFMGLSGQKGIFEQYECENIIDFAKYNSSLTTASGADSLLAEYFKARDAEVQAGANHYTALDCVNNANGAQKVYDLTGDGAITMEVLYQKHYEVYSGDENNYSVCVMINQKVDGSKTNNYLFTGDLEESGEKSLVESNPNLPEMVLFKGGHHGSYTASNDVLLSKIKPQYVCICCCAGNVEYLTGKVQDLSHSFPAQEMIDRVAKYTDKVYVTTLGKIKRNDDDTKWVNAGYESMNGNIVFTCVNGEISLIGSNNSLKLKDTEWFKANRTCPKEWQDEETST